MCALTAYAMGGCDETFLLFTSMPSSPFYHTWYKQTTYYPQKEGFKTKVSLACFVPRPFPFLSFIFDAKRLA